MVRVWGVPNCQGRVRSATEPELRCGGATAARRPTEAFGATAATIEIPGNLSSTQLGMQLARSTWRYVPVLRFWDHVSQHLSNCFNRGLCKSGVGWGWGGWAGCGWKCVGWHEGFVHGPLEAARLHPDLEVPAPAAQSSAAGGLLQPCQSVRIS